MFDEEMIKAGVRKILIGIGDNPDRDGLRDTPKRVACMYKKILDGYDNPEKRNTRKY